MANADLAALVRTCVREELSTALAEGLKPIRDDLKKYMRKVNECDGKVTALETAANATEIRLAKLEQDNQYLTQEVAELQLKAESLEKHSRKCNVLILGLCEQLEQGKPTAFVNKLLCELFGKEAFGPFPPVVVAHRTGKIGEENKYPRPMIMKLYSSEIKHRVLSLAADKKSEPGGLKYEGKTINMVSDCTTKERQQRAKFNDLRDLLKNTKIRFGIAHPAKMLITFQEKTHAFTDASKAMAFYDSDIKPTLPLPP